jgi:hypothetical protein
MVYFQTKPPDLVTFGIPLNGKFTYLLWPFGIHCGHLLHFMAIWYMYICCGRLLYYPHIGIFNQEKSGNPVQGCGRKKQARPKIVRLFEHRPAGRKKASSFV